MSSAPESPRGNQPTHNIVVRGPMARLWERFGDPKTFPSEIAIWGAAGAGKSWGILSFFLWLGHTYPKVPGRVLICRDTRKSLTNSACVTIRKILPRGHPMLEGPEDAHRERYKLGAWTYELAGMDEPARLYSTEWDAIYAMEGREFTLSAWEEFGRGARNFALYRYTKDGVLARDEKGRLLGPKMKTVLDHPWSLTILCTNPDKKESWIRSRGLSGTMAFEEATVRDNPAYWDAELCERTEMGRAFGERMQKLTGVRYRRLVLAEWCSNEGAIWPEWNTDLHVLHGVKRSLDGWVESEELKRLQITDFYAGVDLGIENAGVLLVAGYTKSRELIVLYELFHSQKSVGWWTDWLIEINKHAPLCLVFCDHNRPDWIQAWNDALGVPTESPGAICVKADKGVNRGIEIVRRRLQPGRGAKPTLFFAHDSLMHTPDPELIERHVPYRTLDCMSEYAWKRASTSDDADQSASRPDKPDKSKASSDGADAARYLCAGAEYLEPEEALAEPVNEGYRKRLRFLSELRTGVKLEEDEEPDVDDVDEEDWIVDRIRASMMPDR